MAWAASGSAFATLPVVDAKTVSERIEEAARWTLLDVRGAPEVAQMKVASAQHSYVGDLATQLDALDRSRAYTVMCGSGARGEHDRRSEDLLAVPMPRRSRPASGCAASLQSCGERFSSGHRQFPRTRRAVSGENLSPKKSPSFQTGGASSPSISSPIRTFARAKRSAEGQSTCRLRSSLGRW